MRVTGRSFDVLRYPVCYDITLAKEQAGMSRSRAKISGPYLSRVEQREPVC